MAAGRKAKGACAKVIRTRHIDALDNAPPATHAQAVHRWVNKYWDKDYGMPLWRQEFIGQWLQKIKANATVRDYGCGRGEALDIARELGSGYRRTQGWEVVPGLCNQHVRFLPNGLHGQGWERRHPGYRGVGICLDVLQYLPPQCVQRSINRMVSHTGSKLLIMVSDDPGEDEEMILNDFTPDDFMDMVENTCANPHRWNTCSWEQLKHPHGGLLIQVTRVKSVRDMQTDAYWGKVIRAGNIPKRRRMV